jgi:hypothetical protein
LSSKLSEEMMRVNNSLGTLSQRPSRMLNGQTNPLLSQVLELKAICRSSPLTPDGSKSIDTKVNSL